MPVQGEQVGTEEPGIGQLVSQLANDAREMAQAEVALVKARAGVTASRYKGAAVYFAAAGAIGFATLIALFVGLILTLSPLIGPGFATLAVVGTMLIVTAILALIGKGRLSGKAAL